MTGLAGSPRAAGMVGVQVGGAQMPYVESFDVGTAFSVNAPSSNLAKLHRFRVAKPITLTKMTYYVGAAAGNVDVGIYSWDGTTFTRLTSNGGTPVVGSSAVQDVTFSAPVTLQPGVDYFLAHVIDTGTTVTIGHVSINSSLGPVVTRVVAKTASYPLPATITAPSATSLGVILVAS